MGEQTQTVPQPQSPPHPNIISKKPLNSSKIPVRPNKLRKLSSTTPTTTIAQQEQQPKPTNALTIIKLPDDSSSSSSATAKPRRKPLPPPPIKSLSSSGEIAAALRHLTTADPLLADLIASLPPPTFDTHQAPFLALTKSILYQQLAYKAGTTIYTRFVELCGGEPSVLPDVVLALSQQNLRQIGISGRKATYLFDLAHKYKTGILSDDTIMKMDDKSLFTMLSMVKGIGSWSVHMFMIFSLHRPNVLPVSDVGVRKGVQILYGLGDLPRPSQMEQLCEKWKPYRSVGAWYMWRLVEGKGGPQAGPAAALEGISVMPLQQQMAQQQVEVAATHQQQLQLSDPISGNVNFGACIWGQ